VTSEQPELDRIIGALRSAANASEMAGEDAALDAMASTLASTPATVRSIGSPRSLRVVAVVAASLIGMGGIAAAGAGTFRPSDDRGEIRSADTDVDTTIADTVVDTTIPGPETTVANLLAEPLVDEPLLGDPLVDDPATEFDETECAEGNHGATVSSIAKQTPAGPGHGDEVSIAAQSSCGKNATTDDATDVDATETTVAVTADDDDSPGNSDGKANSTEQGNGNSRGNGRGNGRGG
jgi:hypothetical protein